MQSSLCDQAQFRRLVDIALSGSSAEHTFVSFSDTAGGTTRFANNQIIQNVNTRRQTLRVTVAFGQQHGSASTTDLRDSSIRDAVRRAEQIARVAPLDPEYLPPLPPQDYPILPTLRPETAEAGPTRRIAEARLAIELCRAGGVIGAGIVGAYTSSVGLAASSGLTAFEQRSRAEFSITATGPDSSGWAANANRSVDDLGVESCTRTAIEKALRSANPRELPPGRYTVVLEPAAVGGLLGPVFWPLSAKAYYKGTSAFSGKLDQPVIDARLTLRNRPDHSALLGDGFDDVGLPADSHTWIERGVLRRIHYDRFTAAEHDAQPTYELDAPHLSGDGATGESAADLVTTTDAGILVTNFWYIRAVNPTDLTLTGMTRDGLFLIEGGQLAGGLINFRWHDSPLRAFNQIDAFTMPADSISAERSKMLLPAMRIRDFNFSSVTRF